MNVLHKGLLLQDWVFRLGITRNLEYPFKKEDLYYPPRNPILLCVVSSYVILYTKKLEKQPLGFFRTAHKMRTAHIPIYLHLNKFQVAEKNTVLNVLGIFVSSTQAHIRDLPRFFDQVGHQNTNVSIGNKHFFTK